MWTCAGGIEASELLRWVFWQPVRGFIVSAHVDGFLRMGEQKELIWLLFAEINTEHG